MPRPELERSGSFQQSEPIVEWDSRKGLFRIRVIGLPIPKDAEGRFSLEVETKPLVVYTVQIRKKGETNWGVGFEIPLARFRFVNLQPDELYEIKIIAKDASGKSTVVREEIRAKSQ
jgi:hypothetical protein